MLGVYLHGLAGDLCAETMSQYSMVAGDLIEALPRAFWNIESHPAAPAPPSAPKPSQNQKVLRLVAPQR